MTVKRHKLEQRSFSCHFISIVGQGWLRQHFNMVAPHPAIQTQNSKLRQVCHRRKFSAGNEVASNARRWTDFFRKGCEFDLVGTRLHCTGYLAAVVSSECATTKASTAAFKVVQGLSVSRSLLRQFSHIFIPRLHQAERLSDVKSPLLQPAVTQQLLVSSFLHIAEDKERSKDQGKKTDIGFAVGFLCTAWLFAGCVNV